MKIIDKVVKVVALAAFMTVVTGGPIYAALSDCLGEGNQYPNLSLDSQDGYVYCAGGTVDGEYVRIYGKSSADCAQAGVIINNPDECSTQDLNVIVRQIINTVIFVVGMVAVIMIIIGGVNYATSQGDATKVKRGKDTILYGIIGLVVVLLSFAIVNFVLSGLRG